MPENLPLSFAKCAKPFIFITGQAVLRNNSSVNKSIESQAHAVIDEIEMQLGQYGLVLFDVVRVGVWLSKAAHFCSFNTAYYSRFSIPYPIRSTVISNLTTPRALVEMDVIALKRNKD